MVELEAFLEWLRGKGFSAEQLEGYRSYVTELEKHPSLTAALRAAEEAGATPKRIGNLKAVAARIAEFEESRQGAPATPTAPAVDIDPRDRGALERTPSTETTPAVEPPARPALARVLEHRPPRIGCECRERKDVYLDTDFGALASMIGGGIGIGTLILIRFFGVLGAATIALGLAATGGLVTIVSICFRCEGCRCAVGGLDEDEKAHLRKGRGLVTLVTFGLLAGAALCGFVWWRLVTAQMRDTYPSLPTEQPAPTEQENDESEQPPSERQ